MPKEKGRGKYAGYNFVLVLVADKGNVLKHITLGLQLLCES